MATSLTGHGTITYNGWTFAGPRVSSRLTARPEREETGRSATHLVFTLSVTAYITDDSSGTGGSGSDAGSNVATIQYLLSEDGGALTCTGLGYGNLSVNGGSSNRDVAWGPKTQLLTFNPVGASGCIEVQWEATWSANRCGGGSSTLLGAVGDLKSASYSIEYAIDRRGLTTRTVRGQLAMHINRAAAGGQTVGTSADALREQLSVPPPLDGFQRETQGWKTSADMGRLELHIVDKELPSPNGYPEGVTHMRLRHRVATADRLGIRLLNTFSGSMRMAKVVPLSLGFDRALLLISERVQIAKLQTGNAVLFMEAYIEEDVFQHSLSFSVRYIITTAGLRRMVSNSGLFTPFNSTSHAAWQATADQTTGHRRGLARLKHVAPSGNWLTRACAGPSSLAIRDIVDPLSGDSGDGSTRITGCPDKSKSYIFYRSFLTSETMADVVEHKPMREPEGDDNYQPNTSGTDGTENAPSKPRLEIIIQETGPPTVRVRLRGQGLRAGHPVEIPKLVEIFGQKVETPLRTSSVSTSTPGKMGGCMLYAAQWNLEYVIAFATQEELEEAIGNPHEAVIETTDAPNGEHVAGEGGLNSDGEWPVSN